MVEHIDPEHCEFGSVQLTHYVSPHEFWIKYKDDERASPDNEIQKRIARLVNSDFGYQPSIGEIVILRCFGTLNKLIRVRVDAELHSDNGSEFILWAIDEGYPIRSTKEFIAQLRSEELKNAGSQVYKVTLNSIVPANLVFNIEKGNSERFKTKCWSEKAINEFEKMLNGQLLFHYDCHADVDTQHIYGSLEVISPFGQIINMSTVMKKLDEAVDATDFDFEKQNLTHLSYWLKQHPNYKIKENIKGALSQEDSLSQTLQQCSLNETPLNKRSPLNKLPAQIETPQPPIDSTEPKETHSPKPTSPDIPATNSLHFRKALQEESSFSADVKKRLLCHFPNFPNKTSVRAISLVSEANFTDEVHDKLKSEISQVYRIQALGWPHLMRRSSLILINGPKSGKTWTYLPAVCSLLNEDHCDGKIESGDGPVIIIICLDSYSVKQILSRCHTLLSRQFCCEGGYGREEMEDLEYKLLNGFDVLVTTMPCLSRLMKDSLNFFNKKRITTVVFDDIDAMWDCFGESEVAKIREAFCLDPRIQVIITSKTWHKTLKKFCEKDDMLVCIGAYIEAAVYAKAEFQAEFTVMSSDKENVYKNFLSIFKEQNFDNERTVVICSESDEVIKINEYLKRDGYVCTFCHDKTDSSEI
ncbi:putative ATP-dependent RNA helicase TDRD12, partial [Pseudolycoriella hygida]